MMGERGVSREGEIATMHPNHHQLFHDVVNTYGQHGADNLSLWLTNAKEAAAKITEATKARQREKEEKYGKFLRDLHSRVAVSSKEKTFSKIPQARPHRRPFGQIDNDCNLGRSKCDGRAVHDRGRDLDPRDLFKEVPRMDKVRVYLEKELRKNSKGGNGISKLHRECMIRALVGQQAMDTLVEKPYTNEKLRGDKSSVPQKIASILPKLLTKPLIFIPLPPTDGAQVPDLVSSEPCTPTGWNLIPTSFSALEMRSLESATSPTPLDIRETGDLEVKSPPVLPSEDNSKRLHVESHGVQVLGRSKSSLSSFRRVGRSQMRGKENMRSHTSTGNWVVNRKEPFGNVVSRENKRKQSQCEASVSCSSLSSEGVTTCPMGVVVLKGREEYELRGQGKQFFSDVWKCAMEVERRCAHERAHSLYILKKKRLEQQKAEKRHKAYLLRERSIAKHREAVEMQLKSVAALKARRDGIVQRHRAVEKKRNGLTTREICQCNQCKAYAGSNVVSARFSKKGWYEENPTILDDVGGCEIQGCDTDLTSTKRILCLDKSKTSLKLQALHKQLYLNLLAEKKWMRH